MGGIFTARIPRDAERYCFHRGLSVQWGAQPLVPGPFLGVPKPGSSSRLGCTLASGPMSLLRDVPLNST